MSYKDLFRSKFFRSKFLDMVSWISRGLVSAPHYALFLSAVVILIFTLIFRAIGGLPEEDKPAKADVFDPCSLFQLSLPLLPVQKV